MKEMKVLPELNWKQKLNGRGHMSSANVTVSVGNVTRKDGCHEYRSKRVTFIFRDNLHQHFATGFLAFAPLKKRIYFKEATKADGYSISTKMTSGYVTATLDDTEIGVYEEFVGDYTLKYDDVYELFYIERI